jgi:RNA polymerase sigma factor (sigma-70 family)
MTPSTEDDRSEERIDLQRSLAQLPRRQREVAVMRFLVDLTESDVAASLQITQGAVKQHTRRALAGLRRLDVQNRGGPVRSDPEVADG